MISEVGIDSTLENSYMDPDTDSDVISGLADAPAPPPKNKLNMISKLIPGSGTLAGITHKLAILKQNLPKMLDIQRRISSILIGRAPTLLHSQWSRASCTERSYYRRP